jgi:hypothetical protein
MINPSRNETEAASAEMSRAWACTMLRLPSSNALRVESTSRDPVFALGINIAVVRCRKGGQ